MASLPPLTRLTFDGTSAIITMLAGGSKCGGGESSCGRSGTDGISDRYACIPDRLPWGTPSHEHRLNPWLVECLTNNLDTIERRPDVCTVVVHAEGKFFSNGIDLAWVDKHSANEVAKFNGRVNALFARVLCFPIPTIAALNGHWCAAGGMFGLCFDFRVMSKRPGYFFVPGVDLGIVYSQFQVELMKSVLPHYMHRDVISYNRKRWTADELVAALVVDVATESKQVLAKALQLAHSIESKGTGASKLAMAQIKQKVHAKVLAELGRERSSMMVFSGRRAGKNYAAPSKL